jgi:cytochrome c553
MKLRDALNEFRKNQTIKKFGLSRLKNSGPGLIMPNAVLQCIVDCVHMLKIRSKDDLQIETRWSRTDVFVDAILALIEAHRDPTMAPKAPIQQIQASTDSTASSKVVTCSCCHQQGHNSMFCH